MKRKARGITLVSLCFLLLILGLPGLMRDTQAGPGDGKVMLPGGPDEGGGGNPRGAAENDMEGVLIRAAKPYSDLVAGVEALGGVVTHQFQAVDAIAAKIPRSKLPEIGALAGPRAISKDEIVPHPKAFDTLMGRSIGLARVGDPRNIPYEEASVLTGAALRSLAAENPEAYLINNGIINVNPLHADGYEGQGVIVAVIDSGYRPGFPHLDLDGSVIGGEDFVGDGLGWSNFANSGHGTFVAGMISSSVLFTFSPSSLLLNSILMYAPGAVLPGNIVPMIGTAPLASIYAMRVFPPSGGAATSDILEAVDRAIELRQLYDAGDPSGVNIQVVNMSLSGVTLFAGRDLFDQAVEAFLESDIVHVNSAGNTGPSGLTVGSPGSSLGALTVGAASLAHNERILRDLQYNWLGLGALWRPSGGSQTATFSSRGPDADGRADPDVIASGDACFGMGFASATNVLSIASGTSFSAPSVAGVAAVLRQAFPGATARQIHNAIVMGANPAYLSDDSTAQDQGSGYVDAQAARMLLAGGSVPDALPAPPDYFKSVEQNLEDNAGLTVLTAPVFESFTDLKPGERGEILFKVTPNTSQVVVTISNVIPELPPAQQNYLFGDDIFLMIHSPKTSRFPGSGDYLHIDFTTGGTYVINAPETGIIRVTASGDWTNAGKISTDVSIVSVADPTPQFTRQGKIAEYELIWVPFQVPLGVATAEFRLQWREDWGNYPVNDIDLILVDPSGAPYYDGATFAAPESAVVNDPMPGLWWAALSAYEINSGDDKYKLRISLDGQVIH